MHQLRVILLGLALVMYAGHATAMEATSYPGSHPLEPGSVMPEILLNGDVSAGQLESLGLGPEAPWALSQIKARTVILVAFSMYCPHCQAEAPALNELDALITSRGLDSDLKLIGIGIGNSDFEVDVFRQKYDVTYPLFSDPEFVVNKCLGEVGTPFFYVLDIDPTSRRIRVADTMLGRMESPAAFLERVLSAPKPGS
jgi:peroxiredoxin